MEDPKVLFKGEPKRLAIGVLLNLFLTAITLIVSFFSGSLTLLAVAGNSLADSICLIISFFADLIAKKERTISKTYGYGRVNVFAALINALIFICTACFIFYEAYHNFFNPKPVKALLVVIISALAFAVKISIMLMLLKKQKNINIRTAFLDSLFDALGLFCSFIAGLVIFFTNFYLIDSVFSALIGVLIFYNGWNIVNQTVNILLEGTPKHLDIQKIAATIKQIPLVQDVDNIHIWSISSEYCALSCHVVIQTHNLQTAIEVINKIKKILLQKYNIQHPTIEPEFKD